MLLQDVSKQIQPSKPGLLQFGTLEKHQHLVGILFLTHDQDKLLKHLERPVIPYLPTNPQSFAENFVVVRDH